MVKRAKIDSLISEEELNAPDQVIDPQQLTDKGLNILRKEMLKLDAWQKRHPDHLMMKEDVNALQAHINTAIRASKEYRDALKEGAGGKLEELSDEELDKLFVNTLKLREERKRLRDLDESGNRDAPRAEPPQDTEEDDDED